MLLQALRHSGFLVMIPDVTTYPNGDTGHVSFPGLGHASGWRELGAERLWLWEAWEVGTGVGVGLAL